MQALRQFCHACTQAGCGAGNAVFPLLEANPEAFAYACDFSATAVGLVRAHPLHAAGRVAAFVADLTADNLAARVPPASVDFATLIFVLSAIDPAKMPLARSPCTCLRCPLSMPVSQVPCVPFTTGCDGSSYLRRASWEGCFSTCIMRPEGMRKEHIWMCSPESLERSVTSRNSHAPYQSCPVAAQEETCVSGGAPPGEHVQAGHDALKP